MLRDSCGTLSEIVGRLIARSNSLERRIALGAAAFGAVAGGPGGDEGKGR